jgi:hypothetical protein
MAGFRLVRLSLSAESAAIQQCFSLTTNQRTVLSATINQRNEQAVQQCSCGLQEEAPPLASYVHRLQPGDHIMVLSPRACDKYI